MTQPKLSYQFSMPAAYTFKQPAMRAFCLSRIIGATINVFCGTHKITGAVNCDIDPSVNPDVICDAFELDKHFSPMSFDTAIMDPPYSIEQAHRKWHDRDVTQITIMKNHLQRLIKRRIIWFGYSIPRTKGFDLKEIRIFGHGDNHNATLCVIEDRPPTNRIIFRRGDAVICGCCGCTGDFTPEVVAVAGRPVRFTRCPSCGVVLATRDIGDELDAIFTRRFGK